MNYNEHLSYDQNGNIITLGRNGNLDSDNSVIVIDQLSYSYDDMNRLIKVVDYTGNPSGFKEGVYMGDAFISDKYGNLIEDKHKGFRGATYNHLNLPKKMTFGSNKHITYLYNALGQKLQKKVTDNTTTITTDYQGGFHYENEVLKFFATAGGYVNVSAGRYNYVYNYTDHLGNVRLSYTSDRLFGVRVIEENNYYPFGLKHNGYNNISPPYSVYKYKFNGMELQDELGLNVYDFGARNYMPDLGRWSNIDPLAEVSRRWTPYNYAYNNPVYFIDPDGMQAMSTGYGSVDFETSNIAIQFTSFGGLDKNGKRPGLYIEGEGAKKTFSQLQAATNYKLSRDSETDRVEIGNLKKGTAATNADSALKEAIESTKIITRIISTLNNYNRYNNYIVIGTRDGNRLNSDLTVTSEQTVNPEKAAIVDKFYGMSKGVSVLHEVLEAYFVGGISPFGIGPPTMDTSTPEYKAYLKAHEMAKKADPRFIEPN